MRERDKMKKERESVEREEVINRISAYLYSTACVHVHVCVSVCACACVYAYEGVCVFCLRTE